MIPVSTPFSQWSHQRSASVMYPIIGPGLAWCWYWWPQGPISAFFGQVRPAIRRGTGFE